MRNRIPACIFIAAIILSFALQSFAQTSDDLFNGDILHEIRLYIAPADYATLKETNFTCEDQDIRGLAGDLISSLPRVECHFPVEFHWKFNGRDVTGPQAAVSSHGKGSRSSIKPSFKIDFARYESRGNFLGLREVVLRADTQDASLMHERVAMTFFRKLGIPASREAHARVYVNDQYGGVYTIVEEVDPIFLQRNFGEDNGFLYSYEWAAPFGFNDYGDDSSKYSPLPFNPENHQTDPDATPIVGLINAIHHTTDAQFLGAVSQYLDLNAFFREVAAEHFIADQDSVIGDYTMNNLFLYRFQNSIRSTIVPWDKSNAFWSIDYDIFRNFGANYVTVRAYTAAPSLYAFYRDTLRQAADIAGGPGGWLEQEILKEYQQIRQAVYEDPLKLCDQTASGYLHPCSNDEFEAEVAYLLRFAQQRSAVVRAQLAANP